jgi:hypothetical protein
VLILSYSYPDEVERKYLSPFRNQTMIPSNLVTILIELSPDGIINPCSYYREYFHVNQFEALSIGSSMARIALELGLLP